MVSRMVGRARMEREASGEREKCRIEKLTRSRIREREGRQNDYEDVDEEDRVDVLEKGN